jgi:soluble lytic murein transglycosylase
VLIILFLFVSAVQADIYRYIDENGVMHFTNTPTSSAKNFKLFLREKPKINPRYSTKKYDDIITNASQRHGVSFPLLKAIIKAESGFDPRAVSKKGAKGLMQIMPENLNKCTIVLRENYPCPWQLTTPAPRRWNAIKPSRLMKRPKNMLDAF